MSTRSRAKRQTPRWTDGYRRKSESDVGRIVKPEPIRQPLGVPPPVYVQSPQKGRP